MWRVVDQYKCSIGSRADLIGPANTQSGNWANLIGLGCYLKLKARCVFTLSPHVHYVQLMHTGTVLRPITPIVRQNTDGYKDRSGFLSVDQSNSSETLPAISLPRLEVFTICVSSLNAWQSYIVGTIAIRVPGMKALCNYICCQ